METMTGAELIAAERDRQLSDGCGGEPCGPDRDDRHTEAELLTCAMLIAGELTRGIYAELKNPIDCWMFARAQHVQAKYGDDHVARLAIAGALIAAEIDRLIRRKIKGDASDA